HRTRRGRDRTPDLAGEHFQVAVFSGRGRAAERQGMLKALHPCKPCPGSPCRLPQALAAPSTAHSPTAWPNPRLTTSHAPPDGSAFFGGTYVPADDPVTGRGLKQLLPEVAKSYREQRGVIVQRAALVRQLAVTHAARARGVLQPRAVASQVTAVRATFQAVAGTHAALGRFMHTQAVSLLLATYGRTG